MLHTLNIKKEYLKYSIMTWLGILIALISAKFISVAYVANIEGANKIAQEILLNPGMAQPEPKEKAMFFGTIVLVVLGLFFSYFILNRVHLKSNLLFLHTFEVKSMQMLLILNTYNDFHVM